MDIPIYDSTREYLLYKKEFDEAFAAVAGSGKLILGPQVEELERGICQYTGAKYAVGVASGSDALLICADILGFKDGAEVLTTPYTFFASVSCIARLGGKPVFCDLDEDTFNIDMDDAERRITKNTKGILPVHLFLQTVDMEKCMEIAQKHNIPVLEDCAQAFGMKTFYQNRLVHCGVLGSYGIFSFFPAKTLGGYGDGGVIVTNDERLYKMARYYRVHGNTNKKYYHEYIGYNSRLDTIQAAILLVKLKRIDEAIARKAVLAQQYREQLKDVSRIKLPAVKGQNKEVYSSFNIQAEKRDELKAFLLEKGIQADVYYPLPHHLQECFRYLGYKKGDFPVAERLSESSLALPMFFGLTEDEAGYVCECVKDFYRVH
jgi:dTDP-4-amino-4,6-dideoxygalactose transaminase